MVWRLRGANIRTCHEIRKKTVNMANTGCFAIISVRRNRGDILSL